MSYFLYLHPDTRSFIFLSPRKKNEGAELLMLLATKLDFPPEEAVQQELFGKSKRVLTKEY